MFAPADRHPRADIQVIARGDSPRLRACLDALVAHVADIPFSITCVVNPTGRQDVALTDLPDGVRVLSPELNLGWAGGLHLARSRTTAEFLVWAQEDIIVADGWLDALVAMAGRHPGAGAIGSVEVDPETRAPSGYAGGYAEPPESVAGWNDTDVLRAGEPSHLPLDWITSKGMLTRAAAFDDVRGPDPRLYPLNHVDKDYSVHLRSHGWQLFLAPEAQLFHEGSRSAPALFRRFLLEWQEPGFDRRWGAVARELGRGSARAVDHECATWDAGSMADIERLCGREASLMLVPAAQYASRQIDGLRGEDDALRGEVDRLRGEVDALKASTSWRITAPLRAVRLIGRRRSG
jgi:N-acetylglucosaminyl-diphospho-decaprenol L-rhamnosyltransferase